MTSQPSDYTEFPSEIVSKPLALIGASGLDTINNAVHRTIWEAFASNRRTDRPPLRFKLLPNTFEFPVIKPKRNSYEWYIPKGILKKNWINKRTVLIPAVVVIFYDLEWNDPQWNEKVIECASRVQSIRAAIEGHSTRVAVVVLQSGLSPPPSEYALGTERAQSLCSRCEIQSKSLFVLPHGEQLMGYVARLESAFYDIAQNYYHHETKNIKQHRDHLVKGTHQYLFARHQFKLGYLNELKHDLNTAHKHYLHAYNNLFEIKLVDTNINEVKTVAGFINYKLCKLLFLLSMPRDAITQFKSHIERYKSRVGSNDLMFEHFAWLARQYSAFGELFDEAIRAGLPAILSQHPGFYYQYAAQFTVKRRQAMISVCADTISYPDPPDPLEGITEFYGQRPWRPGRISVDPHDPVKEQQAIAALQYKEKMFNHSTMIISFLSSAISQFKTFHSPRMRKQLVVEMANEYYYSADYGKALTLLTHMLWDYRKEKWWYLASHVLNRALQCAYLAAKVQDYLQLSIEALSRKIQVPNNDKNRIFENIKFVLSSKIPLQEPDLPVAATHKTNELWQLVIDKDPFLINIDMSNIASFIEVKPKFKKSKHKVDEDIAIELYVRLSSVAALDIKEVCIAVSSPNKTLEIPINDTGRSGVFLEGDKVRMFGTTFKCDPRDCGSDVQVKNVTFMIDMECKRKLLLNFKVEDSKNSNAMIHAELLHFISNSKADYEFDSILPVTATHIAPRECQMDIIIHNKCPALQGEWFPTEFIIKNNEKYQVDELSLSLSLGGNDQAAIAATEIRLHEDKAESLPLLIPLSQSHFSPSSNITNQFFIKSNRTAAIVVILKVSYFVHLPDLAKLECIKEFTIKINVVKPFEVTTNFSTLSFRPITKCFVDDPFVIMPKIKITSPWELVIEDTELEISNSYQYGDDIKPVSCLMGLEVSEGNIASDAICIVAANKPSDSPIRVGLYNIKWRRKTNNSIVMSSIALPGIPIDQSPILVHISYPEIVELQKSVPFKCSIVGKLDTPTKLSLAVEGSDAYMFSGYKKVSVTVCPEETVDVCYNLHPLLAGNTVPPHFQATLLNNVQYQEAVDEIFSRNFPTNIFVIPKCDK